MPLQLSCNYYISHPFPTEDTQLSPSTLFQFFSNLEYHSPSCYHIFFPLKTHPSLCYLFLIYVPLVSYSSRILSIVCNGLHLLFYISLCYGSYMRAEIIAVWLLCPLLIENFKKWLNYTEGLIVVYKIHNIVLALLKLHT